jgi:3-deoxy-manno-octulosonate cytidylyltransferase (CMP-KDO synthetase)
LKATVIIPARLLSTRLPEKMILSATGMPLVQHVVEQVKKCSRVREIIVAADDHRIADALKPFGTRVVLTDPKHPSGTDRIAEVARQLTDDLLINVQGDEPEIEPGTVDALVERMNTTGSKMGTVVTPFSRERDPKDPNIVKAVLATDGTALYFSRHAIPFHRDPADATPTYYHHLGIYGYRRDFLLDFAAWPPTPLERSEKLEQLRALEHGIRIDTITIPTAATGIDTPEQYAAFVNRTKSSPGHH